MTKHDIVLFGATGFTGRLAAAYLARSPETAGLSLAIAGRNEARLRDLHSSLGRDDIDIVVADGQDRASVGRMVSNARVVASTAGPFSRFGTFVIEACAKGGVDYVDITGETPWVRGMIERHHDDAVRSGAKIIPFCGFDSVPSDLGAWRLATTMRQRWGVGCKHIRGVFRGRGGINGGTIASALAIFELGHANGLDAPGYLVPEMASPKGFSPQAASSQSAIYDPVQGVWTAPFVMERINARVVERSSALFGQWGDTYGDHFAYEERMALDGPASRLLAHLVSGSMRWFDALMSHQTGRRLVKALAPAPGKGPSQKSIDGGFYDCQLIGVSEDGRTLRTHIRGQGDPGNKATILFMCQSALSLALDRPNLPGGDTRTGFLTPATALGETLWTRLAREGADLGEVEEV